MADINLQQISQLLDEKLKPINEKLNNPETGLDAINKKLSDPETGLDGINRKMNDVIAELHDVHKLAEATLDIVKLNKEKTELELDEIRQHTGMTPAHREPLKFSE